MTEKFEPNQFGTPPPSPVIQLNDTTSMTFRVTDLEFFFASNVNGLPRIVLGFRSGYWATVEYPEDNATAQKEARDRDLFTMAVKMSQFPK